MANLEQPDKPEQPQRINLDELPEGNHRLERIVGNRLECVVPGHEDGIFVKPTMVLEKDTEGRLQLVDKA